MTDIYDAFESWGSSEYDGYDWVDTDLSEQKTYTLDEFKKESNILDTAEKDYEETLLSEATQYSTIQNNMVKNQLPTKKEFLFKMTSILKN